MAYRVKLTAAAEADAAYDYIRELSPRSAEKWLRELFRTIATLDEMPARCPLIAEAEEVGRPLRQLLYGRRSGTYRIIFDIQEQSEDEPRVRVLRIWHSARDEITVADVESEA